MSNQKLYNELLDSLTNGNTMSSLFIENFINFIVKKYDLSKNISYIDLFSDIARDKNQPAVGAYDFISGNFFTDYTAYTIKNKDKNIKNNINFLKACLHELTHSWQREMIADNEAMNNYQSFHNNLLYSLEILKYDFNFYYDHHDEFAFEYQAIILSNYKMLELYDLLKLDDLADEANKRICNLILEFYENKSPIEKSIDVVNNYYNTNIEFVDLNNKDEFTRAMYGYPLKDETLYEAEKILKKK